MCVCVCDSTHTCMCVCVCVCVWQHTYNAALNEADSLMAHACYLRKTRVCPTNSVFRAP